MQEYIEVHSTTRSRDEAEKICTAVVEARLAACAQVSGPIQSTYWWQGKIERSEEFFLTMKTTADRFDEIAQVIRDNHSYEIPDIVSVPLISGIADYLRWISAETRAPDEQP